MDKARRWNIALPTTPPKLDAMIKQEAGGTTRAWVLLCRTNAREPGAQQQAVKPQEHRSIRKLSVAEKISGAHRWETKGTLNTLLVDSLVKGLAKIAPLLLKCFVVFR